MRHGCPHGRVQRLSVLVATLFGLATIVAGGRILLGLGDAGYEVVRPVLAFNTAMGLAYLAAAALIWRDAARGRLLAAGIAGVNLLVLVAIVGRRATGGVVADETLLAMTLRTAVWVVIALALGHQLATRRARAGTAS